MSYCRFPNTLDSTYKGYHIIFVFVWLTLLSIIFPRSIHVAANGLFHSSYGLVIFHYILDMWYICTYICMYVYIHMGRCRRCILSLGERFPWRRAWQLPYSCVKNPMDRGAWWATVYRVAKSWTWLQWLHSIHIYVHVCVWDIYIYITLSLVTHLLMDI